MMPITDYSFLERDATENNDIALAPTTPAGEPATHQHNITVGPVYLPKNGDGPSLVATIPSWIETWTYPRCVLSQADFATLVTVAKTDIAYNSDYPRLNVLTAIAPTFLTYNVVIASITDDGHGCSDFTRAATITFRSRSIASPFTFVLGSGGANAVTMLLSNLESVEQAIRLVGAGRQVAGRDSLRLYGPNPIQATVSGLIANADIEKVQLLLGAKAAVEMVGAAFSTDGSGRITTELPSTSTAILKSFTSQGQLGDYTQLSCVIVKDTSP